MTDIPEPTPEEIAARAEAQLAAIFRKTPSGVTALDVTAYQLAGGAVGVAALIGQAGRRAVPAPSPSVDSVPDNFADYVRLRETLFSDHEKRRK